MTLYAFAWLMAYRPDPSVRTVEMGRKSFAAYNGLALFGQVCLWMGWAG